MAEESTKSEIRRASGVFPVAEAESAPSLRRRAQEEARARHPPIPEDLSNLSVEDARSLLHDLRVHRIELELQNEELRSSQEQLELARARYFDLYDLAPVGYITIGENGIVLEANLTAAGLLDASRSAIVKQPWSRFVFPDDQDSYFRYRRRLLASGAPEGCELRLVKANGEPFWVRLEARVAAGEDRARVLRTVLSDITERKRAEETLSTSEARHRTLFQNSPDALLTLAPPNWTFSSCNAASIAMFGAKGEQDLLSRSFAQCSGERQPDNCPSRERASALLGAALRDGSASFEWTFRRGAGGAGDEFSATVSVARLEAGGAPFLQATVRDQTEERKQRAALGTFARVEEFDLCKIDLQRAIENAVALASNEVRFRATLALDFKPVPLVWASEGKLSQVFLNLLINASHAMDDSKSRTITIRTWSEEGSVCAGVEDTGAGIKPQDMARIFEPFFSTKRIGAGSGLGLSICRNIINEFDGDIQVESEVGKGTRVVVRLPRWTEAAALRSAVPTAEPVALVNLHGRILIIDDEPPLRVVMQRLLMAHKVVSAASGKEALAILEQDRAFDLILCDLMMPGVTGMDVHRWLVEHDPVLAGRVVFITGGAFGPAAADYLNDAGNLKLEKPFAKDEFEDLVSARIRAAKSEPPARLDIPVERGPLSSNTNLAEPAELNPPRDSQDCVTPPFLVVAVGGSVRGKEAFSSLLGTMPSDAPLAVVLLQHLSRTHTSQLREFLATRTALCVVTASDGVRIELGHVYVIPPDTHMTVIDGHLRVRPRPKAHFSVQIDALFRSLAEFYGAKAVGVVLSGALHDGTEGFRAIRAAGGLTFAQVPEEAQTESMPRAAIATGDVDMLPAKEIGDQLLRLAALPRFKDDQRTVRGT